jgi:signal transduction histidine kinase
MSPPRSALRSFAEPGLRRQLAGWIALLALVGGAVSFYLVYEVTSDRLESQLDTQLAGELAKLRTRLAAVGSAPPAVLDAAAARYIDSRPAGDGVPLLVGDPRGAPPASNAPAGADQTREVAALLAAPAGYSTHQADGGELRQLVERITLGQGVATTLAASQSLAAVARSDRTLGGALLIGALVVLVGAMAAAALIATRVSRPLRRMAAVASAVDGGDLEPRMEIDPHAGAEVRVLGEAFNGMLDRLAEAFSMQRRFVADASHELRTPLTVIRGQIEVLAAQREPSVPEIEATEHVVRGEIARMTRLVDDLLLLARSEQPEFLRPTPLDLEPFLDDVWDATAAIAERDFEYGPIATGTLVADGDRVAQALRNLAANAARHTQAPHGVIRLSATALDDGRVRLSVEDDGPGIPAAERTRVFERFHRGENAPRSGPGAGLGLAIVLAIAEAHGGTARAGESPLGGAMLELELPGFSASADAR